MVAKIQDIPHPELFIGFVSPIGADVQSCVDDFRVYLCGLGYRVIDLKVTDIFAVLKKSISPEKELQTSPTYERYQSHIDYGNQIRQAFDDDAYLATMTVGRVSQFRAAMSLEPEESFQKTAFLLHQFKRKEEIDLLRSVYGRVFFQVSVYSRRGARVDYLSHVFANSADSANINLYRSKAEDLVQRDENENLPHGQKVSKIFSDADFIINTDIQSPSRTEQISRFCDLLFGHNGKSPTKIEYGMFVAKAAALRTLDLSRQVGAAIFSVDGEVISIGSNEVPKAKGGTYWSDETFDDREYVRGQDSNDRRKREILSEIVGILGHKIDDVLAKQEVKDSQFMDALEYGRIIHAEMCAITDAARLGRSVKDGVLFSTAFPCHMCAKHIVSAGASKVVFLEPYPKSLVLDLHNDSIIVESGDRGRFSQFPSVSFEHFYGISPRRYRELFERTKRKSGDGKFQKWERGQPQLNLGISDPYYKQTETFIYDKFITQYMRNHSLTDEIFCLGAVSRYEAVIQLKVEKMKTDEKLPEIELASPAEQEK